MQRYLAFLEKKFRPLSKILKIWYNEVIDNNAFLGYHRWIYATALTNTEFLKGTMRVPKRPFTFFTAKYEILQFYPNGYSFFLTAKYEI